MMFKIILVALVLFSYAHEKRTVEAGGGLKAGVCPTVTPMEKFDFKKFSGLWYIVELDTHKQLPRCMQMFLADDVTGKVELTGAAYNPEIDKIEGIKHTALPKGPNEPPAMIRLRLRLPSRYHGLAASNRPTFLVANISILDTDYTHFAVMYSCGSVGPLFADNIIILSRTRKFEDEFQGRVNGVLKQKHLPLFYNLVTQVQDCGTD